MMKNLIAILILSTVSLSVMAEGVPQLKAERGPMKIRKRQARPDIPGHLIIDFGISILQNNDSDLEVELWGSRSVSFYYLYDIRIGSSKFFVLPGIGVGLDRYKFDEDIYPIKSLINGQKMVSFAQLNGGGVKKSMLITNYVEVPLELRFYGNPEDSKRSFKVGVGIKLGYLFGSHSKVKQEVDKGGIFEELTIEKFKSDYYLNSFRYGVTGRIGVGGFNVFYYQRLNSLWESGKGPQGFDVSNATIGISITGF